MKITIEYCAVWGYLDRAVGLTATILEELEHSIEDIALIPSKGGVFEVTVDGALVYSKKATGQHADPEVVLADIRALLRR